MGNTWIVDLKNFVNASGAVAMKLPGRGRMLAEFWAEIVSQATLFDEPTDSVSPQARAPPVPDGA